MRRINYNELFIKTQCRQVIEPYYFDKFLAYDTETIQGRAILISDSENNYIYPKNFEDCINFLTRPKNRDIIGWFYNISFDVEAILKWLSEDYIRELADHGFIKNLKLESLNCTITVIDKKFFTIRRDKHNYTFYDIKNFLPGGLDKNAKKYLGKGKMTIPVDFGNDSDKTVEKFIRSPFGIKYCKIDSERTAQLAELFVGSCNKFQIFAKNFSSPASLATHYFQSNVKIPILSQVTGSGRSMSKKLAYKAYKGGFIESFKKGYFPEITLYDINSAYPAGLAQLPDMTKGKFYTTIGKIPEGAYMGWMTVVVEMKSNDIYGPAYFSPLPVYIKKLNKNFYLAGRIKTTITLLEYEALKDDFNITVIQGSYWIPDELDFLYKESVENLYQLRQQTKDKNLDKVLKTILNGFYGKLIQKIPKKVNSKVYNQFHTGNLFQPFHASYITANCRIQVYNMIKHVGAHKIIAVMTDSICLEGQHYIPVNKSLGGWSKEFEGECLMIGSGLYTLRDGKKIKTATRGFQLSTDLDFFKLCEQNLNKDHIDLEQSVRLSYREALRVKNFTGWNVIGKSIKKININCDNKRQWTEPFKTCKDVLEKTIDSAPIFVQM